MIPDFPKIKKRFMGAINQYLGVQHFDSEILGEGNRFILKNDDGWVDEVYPEKIETSMSLKHDEVKKKGFLPVVEAFVIGNDELNTLKSKMMLDKLEEVTKKTGRSLDGKGKKYTTNMFLKHIELSEFIFDKFGGGYTSILFDRIDSRRYVSTISVTPDNQLILINFDPEHKEIVENELRSNPAFKNKIEEFISKKREKWHDEESNRKLVD